MSDGETVIVIGTRYTSRGGGSGGGGGGAGGSGMYEEQEKVTPTEPEPAALPAVSVATHSEDCSNPEGAAVDIANRIKGTAQGGAVPRSPLTTGFGNTWSNVEFGTLVVQNPDGSFGAANDTIFSNDNPNAVALPNPVSFQTYGTLHSHPLQPGASGSAALSRFPSPGDFAILEYIAGLPGENPNPSAFVIDTKGVLREYKLSDASKYKRDWNSAAAEDLKRITDQELSAHERTEGCDD